ncbi:unnamed protein product [Rhizoctonia solani]|uniref:Uncharacterized protein n=1 Tax=Rhizoctonia solani TaxID=456999 RepID=A0A8H3BW25_9AGAM|nr:unnamed protein product [Rhizoctonia solani]CAE6528152.1 unnamed protein product [Rhizoctonia solani]
MRVKVKTQNTSDEEEDAPRVAASAKKGKRSRQIVEDGSSSSDQAPPSKRRSSSAVPPKSKAPKKSSVDFTDSDSDAKEETDVDVEGSDAPPDDDDAADTASSRSSSPAKPRASRRQTLSKAKSNRVQSDEDGGPTSENEDTVPPPRRVKVLPAIPRRQATQSSSSSPTVTKPLRKPVTSKQSKDKDIERSSGAARSNIPSIPRRPKDASTVVKDTQDMDLLNKDVYNQLFNTSTSSKPATKHVQNEAKQKEIDAKRAAAKAALLEARASSFDLQLPTDKVLAFENRLRKLHRWYAPSALGFTYHEELRLYQRTPHRPIDGNSELDQSTVAK